MEIKYGIASQLNSVKKCWSLSLYLLTVRKKLQIKQKQKYLDIDINYLDIYGLFIFKIVI